MYMDWAGQWGIASLSNILSLTGRLDEATCGGEDWIPWNPTRTSAPPSPQRSEPLSLGAVGA